MFGHIRKKLSEMASSTSLHHGLGLLLFPNRWTKGGVADIRKARWIFVLKPDEIGDVVLATGFLRSLRQQCPDARITIAVKEACAELVRGNAFCDDLVIWSSSWFGGNRRAWRHFAKSLFAFWKNSGPDWVLIPRSCEDRYHAAEYAWWSGATHICAHESFCSDLGKDLSSLVDRLIKTDEIVHEVQSHGRMLSYLGLDPAKIHPRLYVSEAAVKEADSFFRRMGASGEMIAFGIGAGDSSRCWPAENFQTLSGELLNKDPRFKIIMVGGIGEKHAARLICKPSPRLIDATGELSLLGTAELLKQCAVFVGNDSGPMHLAAAAGCAVVEISKHPKGGSPQSCNSPVRFAPQTYWSKVIQPDPLDLGCMNECAKPYPHCITAISVKQVLNAVHDALEASTNSGKIHTQISLSSG